MEIPEYGEKLSRQRRWQIKQAAEGRCERCGKKRGKDGSKVKCRVCLVKHRAACKKYNETA